MNEEAIGRLEVHLGRLLHAGVLSASACLAVGLILWMAGTAPSAANVLLNAGLVALMATPILRVIVSLAEYARMRDWFFVLTTVAVLIVLLIGIAVAIDRAAACRANPAECQPR